MNSSDSDLNVLLKGGTQEIELNYKNLHQIVLVLRAVNHDLRKKIIALLKENETMNVTTIYVKLRIEQSVASQHLRTLRDAGIVETMREGKFVFYKLNKARLEEIGEFINDLTDIDFY